MPSAQRCRVFHFPLASSKPLDYNQHILDCERILFMEAILKSISQKDKINLFFLLLQNLIFPQKKECGIIYLYIVPHSHFFCKPFFAFSIFFIIYHVLVMIFSTTSRKKINTARPCERKPPQCPPHTFALTPLLNRRYCLFPFGLSSR